MSPTDDPDIVPLADTTDCSSQIVWGAIGFDHDVDYLMTYPWDESPDTLDTDGDPE